MQKLIYFALICASITATAFAGNPKLEGCQSLNVGIVLPRSSHSKSEIMRQINDSIHEVALRNFNASNVHLELIHSLPSQPELWEVVERFTAANVSAVFFVSNNEQFGWSTSKSVEFLKQTQNRAIPVIGWNADNSGFGAKVTEWMLQLAPSLRQQVDTMCAILERYGWRQFSIVTTKIQGHDEFVEMIKAHVNVNEKKIIKTLVVDDPNDLRALAKTGTQVILLYATKNEASQLLQVAKGLTDEHFFWIVSQSVVGQIGEIPPEFGDNNNMLGVHFDTSPQAILNGLSDAFRVYAAAVEAYLNEPKKIVYSCETFFRYLQNVSIEDVEKDHTIEFDGGNVKHVTLEAVKLNGMEWKKVGIWQSWLPVGKQFFGVQEIKLAEYKELQVVPETETTEGGASRVVVSWCLLILSLLYLRN